MNEVRRSSSFVWHVNGVILPDRKREFDMQKHKEDQERRKQLEFDRQLERQRKNEQQREEERKKLLDQREVTLRTFGSRPSASLRLVRAQGARTKEPSGMGTATHAGALHSEVSSTRTDEQSPVAQQGARARSAEHGRDDVHVPVEDPADERDHPIDRSVHS